MSPGPKYMSNSSGAPTWATDAEDGPAAWLVPAPELERVHGLALPGTEA